MVPDVDADTLADARVAADAERAAALAAMSDGRWGWRDLIAAAVTSPAVARIPIAKALAVTPDVADPAAVMAAAGISDGPRTARVGRLCSVAREAQRDRLLAAVDAAVETAAPPPPFFPYFAGAEPFPWKDAR